jgi:hypothetical protein
MKVTGPLNGASRRRVLAGAGVVLVVLVLAVTALLLSRSGGRGATAAPTTATATTPGPAARVSVPPAPPTPSPTGPTSEANQLPPSLEAVPVGKSADVGNGISGTIVSLEAISGTGTGPGNIAGPAVRATVRLTNGTKAPQSVDAVTVDMTYGTDRRPASPLNDPSNKPFKGMVGAGDSAVGVYVFTVPADNRSVVTVSVAYQAGAPFMVFTGPVR